MRMLGAGQRDHRKAVRKRRQVLLQLVRRTAGRNEMHLIEIEAAVRGARHSQMAGMNRIERAAKKCNAPRMMFCRCAMGLGCGQSASVAWIISSDSLTVTVAQIQARRLKLRTFFVFFVMFIGQFIAGFR